MPVTASSSSSRAPAKPVDPFHRLVQDLSNVLGPSSGLTSADVDPQKLMELMQKYTSNESEWKPYALGDPTRTFTRNLVDRGNGKSNLVRERMRSPKRLPTFGNPAADGPNTVNFGLDSWENKPDPRSRQFALCHEGSVKETLYTWPDRNVVNAGKPSPLRIQKETVYANNQVTYMSDNLGLHKIGNPDTKNYAVSLHLYTPPNAAKVGCYMFNEQTGVASHMVSSNFYSDNGRKL